MKAILRSQYGDATSLSYGEFPVPQVQADQVLVRIKAASINAADRHVLHGNPWPVRFMTGLFSPKSPLFGADFSGVVVAVGSEVTSKAVGDEVFGDLSDRGFGAYAQYAVAKADEVALKPKNLSFEEAAAVPMAAVTALKGVREIAQVSAGQKVLVNGASGGVGSFALQFCKAMGAEVHAVASSKKLSALQDLGADRLIAYDLEDLGALEERYDVILDAAAYESFRNYCGILSDKGRYVLIGGGMGPLFELMTLGSLYSLFGSKSYRNYLSLADAKALVEVANFIESDKAKPLVDRVFPLQELSEAIRYYESRAFHGKIVISIP